MSGKTVGYHGPYENLSNKSLITKKDSSLADTASPVLSPPPSHPPSTPTTRLTQPRRSPESIKLCGARPANEHPPDDEAFQLGSAQLSTSQIPYASDSQTANTKTSISTTPRQGKYKSHSPVLPSSSQTSARDLEKASFDQQSPRSHHSDFSNAHHITAVYSENDEFDEDDDPKQHAVWILLYLSGLAPVVSLATSLYAILATILILVLSPLCLCVSANPTEVNFQRFLVPPLSLHLGFIYSNFDDEGSSSRSNPAMLVLVNALAPIYAMGICVAAWVAAGFWFFAAILGDPNGKDKSEKDKDDDGKTTVMSVRRWWERWLLKGLQ